MDSARQPAPQPNRPAPKRPELDSWRGDLRDQPPAWRRRPRSERVRDMLSAARPLLVRIGEGKSWE